MNRDRTEMNERLAYHLATALELAHTVRDEQLERELHGPAVQALLRAGDEARALDVRAAERHLSRALAIAGPESPFRPRLLSLHGLTLIDCGRFEEAERTLDAAASALSAAGERRQAAAALSARAHALSVLGEMQAIAVDAEAVALLEGDDPSAELVQVLENAGRNLYAAKGDAAGAADVLERAIASARGLDLPEPPLALAYLGHARCALGEPEGLNDCRRAREAAATLELGADAGLVRLNCTDLLRAMRGPREASREYLEVAETAKQRGWGYIELAARANVVECAVMMGEWEDALVAAADLARETEQAQDVWDLLFLRCHEVVVSSSRGDSACGPDLLRWVIETGRGNPISWVSAYAMLASAAASLRLGDRSQAAGLLEEWLRRPQAPNSSAFSWLVPEAARTALEVGDTSLARRLTETLHGSLPLDLLVSLTLSAMLDEAAGRHDAAVAVFASAAQDWHEFAMPYEEAHALAGRGRCLLAVGRAAAAAAALEEAKAIFVRLRAAPGLAQTEETLRRCPA